MEQNKNYFEEEKNRRYANAEAKAIPAKSLKISSQSKVSRLRVTK